MIPRADAGFTCALVWSARVKRSISGLYSRTAFWLRRGGESAGRFPRTPQIYFDLSWREAMSGVGANIHPKADQAAERDSGRESCWHGR
jgi:hypothetical protein